MKLLLSCFAAAIFLGAALPSAGARDSASMDFFYDNLDPYGNWREVGDYGYVWQPRNVDDNWRPYSDGRWVYTDAGWTWDSDEPFGWAVYHYGRWANVNGIGWIWVPGTEWGPGWVSWRHSPRYTGWAPLPPEALFLRLIGFSVWVDDYYDIGPGNYRFVENRDFGARRLNSVFIDQRQNIQIINQTTNITNITYVNNVVYNGGPVYDQQVRYSAAPIQRYRLDRRENFEGDPRRQTAEHLRSRVSGDSLSVLALPFTGQSSAPPPRLAEKVGRAEVNHGWKNAGSPEEVSAVRDRMKSKVRVPEQLPAEPRFERPPTSTMPREEVRAPLPAEQPPKARPNRDDTPRNPNAPPMTPERKPQSPDRPPAPVPETKKEPMPGTQRPSDAPNPGGRNKMNDPRAPRTDNVPPPRTERKPENKVLVPPQQRMQPKPPDTAPPQRPETPARPQLTPQRPESQRPAFKPGQRPEVTPMPQRPEIARPQTAPTPQPAPQRTEPQRPAFRPAPSDPPPAVPRPPQVAPPVPSPQTPPIVQPPATRERLQTGNERPGKESKKPTEPPK